MPYNTTAEAVLALNPDGILLSNGPGNPAENVEVVAEVKKLMAAAVPMFGVGLGHQLLALANGAQTEKLKHGHRGGNQPVKDLATGRVYITSQNHGYAVAADSMDAAVAEVSHWNVNDKTCEGLVYKNSPAYSVQFQPEGCGGKQNTGDLFNRFMELMDKEGK